MTIVVNAAIIKEGALLLVRKKSRWILPGGKMEGGEKDLETLSREVSEELSGTKLKHISYFNTFSGITPHSKKLIDTKVYFAQIDGVLYDVAPQDSISQKAWVKNFSTYKLTKITQDIVDRLKQQNYL
jgi:ADP-ribose pyrophosphatase YjhB (NUDIX family)